MGKPDSKKTSAVADNKAEPKSPKSKTQAKEIGGPKGLEPTRYGDWERKGIVSDF